MKRKSRELRAIICAINKYIKKHKGEVCFFGNFIAFDKECNVIDDMIIAYGEKTTLNIASDEIRKELKKERGKFVNW